MEGTKAFAEFGRSICPFLTGHWFPPFEVPASSPDKRAVLKSCVSDPVVYLNQITCVHGGGERIISHFPAFRTV
eukprot:888079-Pyramimonas_sp.AAC.2